MQEDIKPVFEWAIAHGDPNIIDRILLKTIHQLIKYNTNITKQTIQQNNRLMVPKELYQIVKTTSEKLIGSRYQEIGD